METEAFVLRVVDYREADRIVTLLSADLGKVGAIARGARRSRRRFSGALEPYAVVRADLRLGRGELAHLTGAQVVRPYPRILTDLKRIEVAGLATVMVRDTVPPREPDPRIFHTFERLLRVLDELATAPEIRLLQFQVRLLTLAGYAPNLEACGSCGKRPAGGQAALFDPQLGSLVCRACGGAGVRLDGPVRQWLSHASTEGWWRDQTPVPALALEQSNAAIHPFLAHRVGRREPRSCTIARR